MDEKIKLKSRGAKGKSSVIFFKGELKKPFENQREFEEMAEVKIEQKWEESRPGGPE